MEFCFLCSYGQTSTDWAAWAGVLVTGVALGITYYVASSNDRQRRNEIFKLSNTYATQLLACVAAMRDACQRNDRDELNIQRFILSEIHDLGRSIQVDMLPGELPSLVFKLRGLSAEINARSESIRYEEPNMRDIGQFSDDFERLRLRIHNASVELNFPVEPVGG
jgi:hypothetical protein